MSTKSIKKKLQKQNPLLMSPIAFGLAACGGGGDSDPSKSAELDNGNGSKNAVDYLAQSDAVGIMTSTSEETFQWMPDGSERAVVRYFYPNDLDADGNDELVIAGFETQQNTPEEYSNTNIFVFSINEDGVLENRTDSLLPGKLATVEAVGDIVFGDFNGDGRQDFFTSAYADMGHVVNAYEYTQLTDGSFTRKIADTTEWQHGASVGDINSDGFDDVVVTGYTLREVYVYVGSPDGLLQYNVSPATKENGDILVIGGSGLTFGDFLNNGEIQVVTTDRPDPEDSNTALFSLTLDDANKLATMEKLADLPGPILDREEYENYLNWDNTPRPGERSHDIRVDSVDFNNDGLLDVVVFSTGWPAEGSWPDISTVQLLQNNGDGSFFDVTDDLLEGYNIDSNSSYATVFADFNDDGWVDMLVSDSDWNTPNTSTSFILSNGDGTFSEQGRDIITSLNDASSGMGTALQDSEGQVYLILAEQFIHQGNSFSDPTFETITAYPVDFL
jgi:hypothetical protein